MKNINVAVLVQNTHANPNDYYGAPRATMVAPPAGIPNNIAFISNCIAAAQTGFRNTSDPTLGTIVVLPEFILQPQEGAYTAAQRTIVEGHLGTILANTPTNVLVVFGTIVNESAAGGQFYNDLMYGIGGGALQHTGKLNLSNIDLIHDGTIATTIGWDAAAPAILKQNTAIVPLQWNQSPGPNHTINFQGKRIGLSVCLDYAANLLATRIGGNPVDIHVVSSCGMQYVDGQTGIYNDTAKVIVCDAFGEWSSVNQVNQAGQSKQKSSMLTTESQISGVATKIRRTQILVPA
jgi:hypothetical protein